MTDADGSAGRTGPAGSRVVTWNVEWAPPRHLAAITQVLTSVAPDILVLTEGRQAVMPQGGHVALAGPNWGYPTPPDRRKVLLWSRYPLTDINLQEESGLPPGRLVTATCHTPSGPWWIVGACIPWRDAHVRMGRRDATPWQEHLSFLEILPRVLSEAPPGGPVVVAGDFNQRLPSRRVPDHVAAALEAALRGLTVCTAGPVPGLSQFGVDHIAVSAGLVASRVGGVDRRLDGLTAVSDHDLVWVDLAPSA